MASSPTTAGHLFSNVNINNNNIKKCGYLKKQKHGHKRFFVLKEQSDGFPARLEYYENEKKWKNKSAAKRVIPLDSCLNINKRADAKHKHLIALYTKDEYFAVAADNEQEQENWYRVLTDLMNEGKVYDGSASKSASSFGGFEENYGMITPVNATYKEVWQVNLKSKGLGQSKNLTGVYRLCLSSRTISFVKINSEIASVSLQLMNIRRCGHSDSYFFIEVGRSASTGPGELWMQADDSVVAQNIHETILEAMKAMKELSEFRPRSKSQSSGTNPISVPTRRHLNNLPPSQTGLLRRSRTDSMAATSPVSKFTSCRIRTASEGDGTMSRPMSVSNSPISPSTNRVNLSRSNTVTARPCRIFESSPLQHSKSMSMPASQSPPPAASPVSLSSSSGNGSASEVVQRPSSSSASVSGSPCDAGFMSCDDYSTSPGDVRHQSAMRSNTPESIADTPPSREGSDGYGYMVMERPSSSVFGLIYRRTPTEEILDLDKAYRKRTYSLTTPSQQRAPAQVSSASLDEYTLMRATHGNCHSGRSTHTASPKVTYPEDYGDIEIGSLKSLTSHLGDDGYMPMTPGVASLSAKNESYMPMSPMCVSAPKQIINPRYHPQTAVTGLRTDSPGFSSLEDSGYMRMFCSSKLSMESSDGKLTNGEYMNMSPVDPCVSLTPTDYLFSSVPAEHLRCGGALTLLPRGCKAQTSQNGDADQYVLMSPQSQKTAAEPDYCAISVGPVASTVHVVPQVAGKSGRGELFVQRGRVCRSSRLILDTLMTLPSMNEHPLPAEPKSPGEYINIEFNEAPHCSPPSFPAASPSYSPGSNGQSKSSLSDYMNIDLSKAQSPKSGDAPTVPSESKLPSRPYQSEEEYLKTMISSSCLPSSAKANYAKMAVGAAGAPLQLISQTADGSQTTSPTTGVKGLTLSEKGSPVLEAFLLSCSTVDPDRGAKVIRADPQGRRRHSSETFSSTTTVTPVYPSFAHDPKRHSSASVENVSVRKSDGSDEECGSPMCRKTSAGFQNGLNYIALNLMDGNLGNCENIARLKAASYCKGGINGIHATPYVSLGFSETATTVKD